MYFRNRSFVDKLGLCFSYGMILYFGVTSTPLLLHREMTATTWTQTAFVVLNVLVCATVFLLVRVSNTRGYLREEEYISGGKFCYECRMAKAERAHHCSRCQKCINRMDHHCPWIGACVNGENSANFAKLVFVVFSAVCLSLVLYAVAIKQRVQVVLDESSLDVSFFMLLINFLLLGCVLLAMLALLVRHTRLVCSNITYLESLQLQKLDSMGLSYPRNPYDKGRLNNIKEVFGSPVNFFLCTTPAEIKKPRYVNYWPPVRLTKSGVFQSQSASRYNTDTSLYRP